MSISVKNLSVKMNGHDIFRNVRFEIERGRKALISGPSGSGKTTLLKTLMGFIIPVKGEIFYSGQLLSEKSVRQLRKKIAWIPQEIVLPDLNTGEFMRYHLDFTGNRKIEMHDNKIKKFMAEFSLDDRLLTEKIVNLSGGQKSRILIILAILQNKPFYIIDEPVAALDTELQETVLRYIYGIQDATILISSHDGFSKQYADQVIFMNEKLVHKT